MIGWDIELGLKHDGGIYFVKTRMADVKAGEGDKHCHGSKSQREL